MDESELQQKMTELLKADFQKQFIAGATAGWNACASFLYNKIKGMTSAKAIKECLKEEKNKSHDRIGKTIE